MITIPYTLIRHQFALLESKFPVKPEEIIIDVAKTTIISSHIIAVEKLIKFMTSYFATNPSSDWMECPRENKFGSTINIVKYAAKRKIKGANNIDILNNLRSHYLSGQAWRMTKIVDLLVALL